MRKPPGTGRKGREALTFWESGFCAASALGFASNKTEGLLVDGGRGPPGWGAGKGEHLPLLPSLSIPLCPFRRTFKGRRPLPTPFLTLRGLFTSPVLPCPFCSILEARHTGEADRSHGRLRVHPRKQGFKIAGREASGLAKPTPQPAPGLHEPSPRSSQGVGAAWRGSPLSGREGPGAQHRLLRGRVSSSFQGRAWTMAGVGVERAE